MGVPWGQYPKTGCGVDVISVILTAFWTGTVQSAPSN